jgi:hypothetical protein
MARILKKFHVGNGDILALKHQSENANADAIEVITQALTKMNIMALVVVVADFDDMSVLNETAMNKQGWFHLKQLSKLARLQETNKDGQPDNAEGMGEQIEGQVS